MQRETFQMTFDVESGDRFFCRGVGRFAPWCLSLIFSFGLYACGNNNSGMTLTGGSTAVATYCGSACTYSLPSSFNSGASNPMIDSSGNVWLYSNNEIVEIQKGSATNQITFCQSNCDYSFTLGNGYSLSGLAINPIRGDLWIGTNNPSNSSLARNGTVIEIPKTSSGYGAAVTYCYSGCTVSLSSLTDSDYIYSTGNITSDPKGNVWMAAYNGNSDSLFFMKIPYTGASYGTAALIASTLPSGSTLQSIVGLTSDAVGNVWLAASFNNSSTGNFNNNTIVLEYPSGTSPPTTFCSTGGGCTHTVSLNNQSSSYNNNSFSFLSSDPTDTTTGSIWVDNGSNILKISANGTVPSSVSNWSFPNYSNGGGIAVDSKGNVWVVEPSPYINGSTSSGIVTEYVVSTQSFNYYCSPGMLSDNSPCNHYTASINNPSDIAIDLSGTGNVWVQNSGWVTELIGAAQ